MQSKPIKYKFKIPEVDRSLGQLGMILLQLGALAEALSNEDRFLVDHASTRPENDAEHAHMLSRIAPMVAISIYPKLDPGLISLYATIHDDVEAYVGDTPTHEYNKEVLENKQKIEKAAMVQLLKDFKDIPEYTKLIKEYEEQRIPEARFVRALDKLMPVLMHYNDKAACLKKYWTKEEFLHHANAKTDRFKDDYPEFIELFTTRAKLIKYAAETFYA